MPKPLLIPRPHLTLLLPQTHPTSCHHDGAAQVERAKLEKAVEDELAAEAAADEEAKQQKREQIAAEEQRLLELEEQRQAEVRGWEDR